MYVVTVEFHLVPEHRDAFLAAVRQQAVDSLAKEPACRHFDVCTLDGEERPVFLYELYDDRAAFDAHLASDHFIAFNARVAPWTQTKIVRCGTLEQGTDA